MIVIVTNLTDAPGHAKGPNQVDIYNRTLSPGESLKLPAELVTDKLRALANGNDPLIAIGSLPPWYLASKKRKGKPLTLEERQKMISTKPLPVKETNKEVKGKHKTVAMLDEVQDFKPTKG